MPGRLRYRFFLKLLLLVTLAAVAGFLFFAKQYLFLLVVIPVILGVAIQLGRSRFRVYSELEEYSEAIRYRDFTRSYPIRSGDEEIELVRRSFQSINTVFKDISSEKEIQHQYLQSLLDIVDTGIISYDIHSGKVAWMNESFKRMFGIPYLPTFDTLQKKQPDLYLKTLQTPIGANVLLVVRSGDRPLKLILTIRDFRTAQGHFRMLSYQNVNDAIDRTESQAWQKLLSVLTHEIMNSIAPISSLAATLSGRLQNPDAPAPIEDIRVGIDTIRKRSDGLLKFAQTYRSLNNVTRLNVKRTELSSLFENIYQLFEPTLIQKNIELDIILKDPALRYEMDNSLIEQVLINLTLNAIEAVKETPGPYISLSGEAIDGRLQIQVKDNGKGIPSELLENVFIPFFTTRKTGSGVGLTLAKKIMLLHGGNILVESRENAGSTFTLAF